jgi:hypothetical protein
MVLLLPLPPLVGADRGSAILHGEGAWLNGTEISGSTAVSAGDSVETKPGFVANLDAEGSSILIQPQSTVKIEGEIRRQFLEPRAPERVFRNLHVDERARELYRGRSDYEQTDAGDVNDTVQVAAHITDRGRKFAAQILVAKRLGTVRHGSRRGTRPARRNTSLRNRTSC